MTPSASLLVTVFVLIVSILISPAAFAGSIPKTDLADQGFIADFYNPEGSSKKVAILLLGGSDGGKPNYLAKPFITLGYPVLSLAYFKTGELPEYLDMIPLEYFDKPLSWLQNSEKTKNAKIVAVGISKGAELSLLLASRKPQIAGVVAMSPSSVVWQGIAKDFQPPRSSWSFGGTPVPFVPYDTSEALNPNDMLSFYKRSLGHKEPVQKAAIAVEKIKGPILLLSGDKDSLWPSAEMGERICRRLKENRFKYSHEHITYADAGHTFSEYYLLGGSTEGNKQARLDSARKIAEFLKGLETE